MRTVFTLASGRSGTKFLGGLLRRNLRGCVVRHEPYFDPRNPNLFGLPIYDHATGNHAPIRKLLAIKARRVRDYAPRVYIETSHAFLKSYWDLAPEFFPGMSVIHLVRDPLRVARSEANREQWIEHWRVPFRHYRGRDGRKRFRWALTGLESIFGAFDGVRLTRFQWYLIQWIEIENRAMEFLARFGDRVGCFTTHSPADLNDHGRVAALLRFLELEPRTETPVLTGLRNRTPGRPTAVGRAEAEECRAVIERLPERYLRIFDAEPYTAFPWRDRVFVR
jgi:hypothetical protein